MHAAWVSLLVLVAPAKGTKPAKPAPAPKAAPAPPAAPSPSGEASADTGKKDVAPPTEKAKPRFFEGMGKTPQEEKQLEELSQAIESYEAETKDFKHEVQVLIEKKYEEKRNTLANSYEKAIRDLEVIERKERLDAIAQFEEFLQRYPDDPKYTPDVMFRLGELYYERSSDDQVVAMRDYEEKLKALDPSKNEQPPPEPQVDFTPSIGIYKKLIAQFPDYRLNDGSYYLLGYCLEKQNEFDKSRAAYQDLIAKYPTSKFTTEAWVRIGEYYFDAYNEPDALTQAADAYEHAIKDKTHPLYDKALYKLGWTYYRMDHFDDAVDRFLRLADYYEAQAKARGDEEVGGDLRNEALQYTAISFADEKWGSLAKAQEWFQKNGGRPYEGEIYRRMGDVYFDQTKHADAIAAYSAFLEKNPLAKNAPQVQQRIVQAYERDRKLEDAFRESEKLATMFGNGTVWHEKWKRDPEILQGAQDLAEKSLYSSAIYHHQQALLYKQEGKFDLAKPAFEVAAKAYGGYLQKFPRSKNSYEMQFYYAECLYNSFQFEEAGKEYEAVRDSTQDNKFFKDAAFAAVLAWQKEMEQEVKEGKIPDLKPLKSNERPEGEKVKVYPIAETEKRFVSASDAFVQRLPQDEKTAGIAYKAAELFYSHNDFVEARKRFEQIVQTFPSNEVAKYATNLIVESYLVDKDWKSVEEVSAKLAQNTKVIDPKSDLYKDLVKFKLAGRFKLAEELMQKGDYDNAAKKYIELVDEEPKHEFADKALNNAAVCYENSRRFDSALKIYERIFSEYPNSPLAPTALFRVAVNAENSYDFDKAVENYQKLVKDYPTSKDREAALYNAARLLEGQQRYAEAASAFLKYAELFPKSDDAPKNVYRAALIYEKQSDWKGEIRALSEFSDKYKKDSAQAELFVDAKKRIGDAYQKLGNDKEAKASYEACGKEFDKRGLKPDAAPIGAQAAAQCRFQLAEYDFKVFDAMKIGGRGKALEKSFTAKANAVKKMNEVYGEVFKYKQLEWTLAALYRRGYALERFANTLIETPVPPDVKRLGEDAVVAYQDQIGQKTAALEDKAVESYATTLAEARKNHITNEWTQRTLESLNRYRPKEYPVLKDPKPAIAEEEVYPEGLVPSLDGPPKNVPNVNKLQGDDK